MNSSRSAFACFSFNASFFAHFEPELSHVNQLNASSVLNCSSAAAADVTVIDENDDQNSATPTFKCKMPAKCLLAIFRNINALEKSVERCTITVKYIPISEDEMANKAYDYDSSTMLTKRLNKKSNEEQLYDTKFLIIMNCKHAVRKTFILSISDCENLQTAFTAARCTNKLNISARYLHETINSFSSSTEEVTFVVEAAKMNIKNYVEPDSGNAHSHNCSTRCSSSKQRLLTTTTKIEDTKGLMNTQVSFDADEFHSYEIERESDISFCLKELKICLMFGNWFDLALDMFFQKKGRPIIFAYSGAAYEANFIFSTLADDSATTQSSLLSTSASTSSSSTSTSRERRPSASVSSSSRRPALDISGHPSDDNENNLLSACNASKAHKTSLVAVKSAPSNK